MEEVRSQTHPLMTGSNEGAPQK